MFATQGQSVKKQETATGSRRGLSPFMLERNAMMHELRVGSGRKLEPGEVTTAHADFAKRWHTMQDHSAHKELYDEWRRTPKKDDVNRRRCVVLFGAVASGQPRYVIKNYTIIGNPAGGQAALRHKALTLLEAMWEVTSPSTSKSTKILTCLVSVNALETYRGDLSGTMPNAGVSTGSDQVWPSASLKNR